MEDSPEIEAQIRRTMKAVFKDHDIATATNLVRGSRDSRSRMILVAEDEWYQGSATAVDGEALVLRAQEIGVTDIEFELLEAYEHGDVGWAAGLTILHRGQQEPVASRFTATYVLEDGSWANVQWHASIGVSNTDAWGVELSNDLADLVSSLDESSERLIEASSDAGTVTLLFSDVENSTQLSQDLGDDEWATLITRHLGSVRASVEKRHGTLIKTLGDGAMAAFSSVADGLDAALAIQSASATEPFDIRVGLHTGDAIFLDGDYLGITVNKAARVASAAEPGETLLSSVTAEMATGRSYGLGTSRTVELKGLTGTHRLTQLLGPHS